MNKIFARMQAAFRTNDTQSDTVVIMTGLSILALLVSPTHLESIWWWIFAVAFWPTVAYVGNLFMPIQKESNEK